jgi:hypothetical protein
VQKPQNEDHQGNIKFIVITYVYDRTKNTSDEEHIPADYVTKSDEDSEVVYDEKISRRYMPNRDARAKNQTRKTLIDIEEFSGLKQLISSCCSSDFEYT